MIERSRIIPRADWRKTWLIRQERIKKEGSEYFSWIVPVTAAAARVTIEIAKQFPRAGKYMPLDFVEVSNNDDVDLTLTINGAETLPVPSGTIRSLDNAALWQIGITNNDAVTSTVLNRVTVTLRRQPMTIDKWAQRGA
ncbi:MAG: hypothetical protein KKD44_26160 [Proteobacteria bacterium]|nr:hypothetical protein [Patescibacteria group bacterium]MBU1173062.1 hypothetical protein [Pseudomonadota bacterium]